MTNPIDVEREMQRLATIREMYADYRRWKYVKDNLVREGLLLTDGTAHFGIVSPAGRGKTIDDVIDQLIEASIGREPK